MTIQTLMSSTESCRQSLSQDLETGCPKLAQVCKILGHHIFQGNPKYTQITAINMDLLIEIRHNVHILHAIIFNNVEVKKNSTML